MKLGCIGYGNMAGAIIDGALNAGVLAPQNVYISDPSEQQQLTAKGKELNIVENTSHLLNCADMILLSVKPNNFTDVLRRFKLHNYQGVPCFLSIAAGISIESIQLTLGKPVPVIRAMPNTPLLLGAGTTAICRSDNVDEQAYLFAREIFSSAGTLYELPESQFDAVINLNGSSPAYIYYFAQIVAEYTNNNSEIPFNIALSMFSDTLIGAAKMMKESDKTPEQLIQAVSSPGGTTVAALQAFKATGFDKSLQAGLSACVQRAKEMGK